MPLEVVYMQPQTATRTEPVQEADQAEVVVNVLPRARSSAPCPSRRGPRSSLSPRGCAPPSPMAGDGPQGRAEWVGKWRDWLLDHADEL